MADGVSCVRDETFVSRLSTVVFYASRHHDRRFRLNRRFDCSESMLGFLLLIRVSRCVIDFVRRWTGSVPIHFYTIITCDSSSGRGFQPPCRFEYRPDSFECRHFGKMRESERPTAWQAGKLVGSSLAPNTPDTSNLSCWWVYCALVA